MTNPRTIYLDYNATTPCDPRVVEGMLPYFTTRFANPSSVTHFPGRQAADALETAREQVAGLLGASPKDVLFTSGATESNNLALYGVARAAREKGDPRRRIITLPTEHKAVLEPCQDLANQGFDIQYAPVDSTGLLDLKGLAELLTGDTLLVSIQAANSEIGTLQPLDQIAQLVKETGAYLHCDATQAVGRVAFDWQSTPIDLLSFSSHKIYGPKGAGALLARRALRHGKLSPLSRGGSQEQRLRAGTQNVPAIVGFGLACQILQTEAESEIQRMTELRDQFEHDLKKALPQVSFNGHSQQRLPNTSSVTVPSIDADALLANLSGMALSLGSACNAGALEPSYVLTTIGLSRADADATFRLSVGRPTTSEEIATATQEIINTVSRIQLL